MHCGVGMRRMLAAALVALSILAAGCSKKTEAPGQPWMSGMPAVVPPFKGEVANVAKEDKYNSIFVTIKKPGLSAVKDYAQQLRDKEFEEVFISEGPGQYFANFKKEEVMVSLTFLTENLIINVQTVVTEEDG